MYSLPFIFSALFFPIGFLLAYLWGSISSSKLVIGIFLLSMTAYHVFSSYPVTDYYLEILLALNLIGSLYLLGLTISYKRGNDQHFGGMNPVIVRWISIPVMTLLIYLAVIVICAASGSEVVLDVHTVVNFLFDDITLSILLVSWMIFHFWSYATIKEVAS